MSSSNNSNASYKKLSEIEHVLLRPGMYAGSVSAEPNSVWVFRDGVIRNETVTYIPAVLKFFDEIISNSVDNSTRDTEFRTTAISVDIDRETGTVCVFDNGGIPVELSGYGDNEYIPDLCFGNLRAGSNFNDDDTRTGVGTNGLGSVLTNIFSKTFTVDVCDSKMKYHRTWNDNMSVTKPAKISEIKSGKHYTKITYLLDYERFNMDGIDDSTYDVLISRVYEIAGCNPKLDITLNGNKIKMKSFFDYCYLYLDGDSKDDLIELNDKQSGWSVAIAPSSGEYNNISFVNSNRTFVGGTHEQYILSTITSRLKEHILKKYKYQITTDQLKNNMFLFINAVVGNPKFSSQTKERLCSDKADFINPPVISEKFIKDIIKSEVMNKILDWIESKKKADESAALRKLNKVAKNVMVENLIDANINSKEEKTLFIYEGKSAISSFRKFRDPKTQGAISIRGKLLNTFGMNAVKALQNKEINDIFTSLGLKVGENPFNYDSNGNIESVNTRYDYIAIATDADIDGDAICGLILCLFNQFFPEFIKHKRIFRVMTPLLTVTDKKSKKRDTFYTAAEYDAYVSKNSLAGKTVTYLKGLGSLNDEDCKEMLENPVKMFFTADENMNSYFETWYGKDSQLRKDILIKM